MPVTIPKQVFSHQLIHGLSLTQLPLIGIPKHVTLNPSIGIGQASLQLSPPLVFSFNLPNAPVHFSKHWVLILRSRYLPGKKKAVISVTEVTALIFLICPCKSLILSPDNKILI